MPTYTGPFTLFNNSETLTLCDLWKFSIRLFFHVKNTWPRISISFRGEFWVFLFSFCTSTAKKKKINVWN